MSHEALHGEEQQPGLVFHEEHTVETTDDREHLPVDVTRYTFQREDAATADDPYVQIERRDTGADTAFLTQGALRRSADGEVTSAGTGPGPGAELSLEIQADLGEAHNAVIAEQLAGLMFRLSDMQL